MPPNVGYKKKSFRKFTHFLCHMTRLQWSRFKVVLACPRGKVVYNRYRTCRSNNHWSTPHLPPRFYIKHHWSTPHLPPRFYIKHHWSTPHLRPRFYGRDIRAFEILRGDVGQPEECACLYEALQSHRRNAEKELVKMAKTQALKAAAGQGEGLRSKFSVSGLPPVYAACNFHNTVGGNKHILSKCSWYVMWLIFDHFPLPGFFFNKISIKNYIQWNPLIRNSSGQWKCVPYNRSSL